GGLMTFGDPVAERQLGEALTRSAVMHPQAIGRSNRRLQPIGDTQPGEGADGIGSELYAGAGLRKLTSSLEHPAGQSLPGQGNGKGKAADAGSGDQNGPIA